MSEFNEEDFLKYVTENYSKNKKSAQKDWSFHEYFNLAPEDLDDMLLDLFTRYHVNYENFILDNYFEPEVFWWQWRKKKEWKNKKLKSLTLEMIIESAKKGHWLYD